MNHLIATSWKDTSILLFHCSNQSDFLVCENFVLRPVDIKLSKRNFTVDTLEYHDISFFLLLSFFFYFSQKEL